MFRRVGSVEVGSRSSKELLEATPEADLEARLVKEQRRLTDMEKELKLEIQMKVSRQFTVKLFRILRIRFLTC
jgi:hypothetical protein